MCLTPKPYEQDGSTLCGHCFTPMHECLTCHEQRCQPEIIMSMVGSFPLACRRCRPDGIRQELELGEGGVYSPGTRLLVEGEEAFTLTDP